MDPLELVRLHGLMGLTRGRADVVVALLDGPVSLDHPDLATGNVQTLGEFTAAWRHSWTESSRHGSSVAGVLAARRGAKAPAIAPDCTLLVRPVFLEASLAGKLPSATPRELAEAIVDCVDAGARILNLSVALTGGSFDRDRDLQEALEHAARREALVVAAAGNQHTVGGSVITRARWVIPVVAYSQSGQPLTQSTLGRSIGIGGLGGPGESVVSLGPNGESAVSHGTSIATPFVTGAAALLWSLFPMAAGAEIRAALLLAGAGRRRSVIPPLLNAWHAFEILAGSLRRRAV